MKIGESSEELEKLKEDRDEVSQQLERLESKKQELEERRRRLKKIFIQNDGLSPEAEEKANKLAKQLEILRKKVRNLEKKKNRKEENIEYNLNTIQKNSKYVANHLNFGYSINGTIQYLVEELNRLGIEPEVDEITLKEFVQMKKEREKGVLRKIGVEIMEKHREAAKNWESENETLIEEIVKDLKSDLNIFSKNLYKVRCNPDAIKNLFRDELREENFQEIKQAIEQGWESAK